MSNNRVDVKYHHWFPCQTDNGKAFSWLKNNLGSACDDAITNVVRFVYLPIALAEAGASRQEVEIQIRKAREFLNEKMMVALGSCAQQDENSSAASNGMAPVSSKSVRPFEVVPAAKGSSNELSGANTSWTTASGPNNGFLELDEDKLMED